MSIFNDITYNKVATSVSIITALTVPSVATDIYTTTSSITTSSYDKSINYTTNKQSTIDSSNIKNDIEMLRLLEIDELNNELNIKFNTFISKTWLPANNILNKSCLFVTVDKQEELIENYEDFELELYLALEEKINKSSFFDMIALI